MDVPSLVEISSVFLHTLPDINILSMSCFLKEFLTETETPIALLDEDEKDHLVAEGYVIKNLLAKGACSVLYYSESYRRRRGGKDYPTTEPIQLVGKVMEAINAPKDFTKKFLPRELAIIMRIRTAKIKHVNTPYCILQYKTKIIVFSRFAELGTLYDFLATNQNKINERWVRIWFRQLAVGLAHLHHIEVVHRDLKCENILVTAKFNVKISDFGFSRLAVDNRGKHIYSSTFCGTMGYVAPEVLKGVQYIPKLSDVWALGIVLFIMLNGEMPFPQKSMTKLHRAQTKKNYSFRKSVENKVSPQVIHLVSCMLEPRWFERITSTEILSSPWLTKHFPDVLTFQENLVMVRADDIKLKVLKPVKKIINRYVNKDNVIVLMQEIHDIEDEEEF